MKQKRNLMKWIETEAPEIRMQMLSSELFHWTREAVRFQLISFIFLGFISPFKGALWLGVIKHDLISGNGGAKPRAKTELCICSNRAYLNRISSKLLFSSVSVGESDLKQSRAT